MMRKMQVAISICFYALIFWKISAQEYTEQRTDDGLLILTNGDNSTMGCKYL